MNTIPLTVDDIADLRAWERSRPHERSRVVELRRRRRVTLDDVLTGSFENRDTVRWQIQEMLRVERSLAPGAVTDELQAYNPLLPGGGELSLTLFVDVTVQEEIAGWLRRLAGLENHVALVLPDGAELRARPEEGHRRSLTRDDVTSAVHYLRIPVPRGAVLAEGTRLRVDHPAHRAEAVLRIETLAELAVDLHA